MVCKNCGKELTENTKFCDGCGTTVDNTEIAPKKKKKGKLAIIILAVIAVVFIGLVALSDSDSQNDFIVETGIDDIYGGVAFNLTLDEFINKYNSCVEANKEYDLAADFDKLDSNNFEKIESYEGTSSYAYSFGYTTGTFPMVKFNTLGILAITVNDSTEKIQSVKYVWQAENYNTEEAKNNYHYTIPARIFSMVHSEIAFPYNDDYSSYYDFLKNYYDCEDIIVLEGNTLYGVPDTGSDDFFGFQMIAATDDSEFYRLTKNNIID